MVKNLYINGCSFLSKNPRAKIDTHAGLEVARLLNLNPLSYARGGRGNSRIASVTREFFYDNPKATKDTLVLIGWSAANRQDALTRSKHLLRGASWKSFKYSDACRLVAKKNSHLANIKAGETLRLQHLCNILAMQDFFEARQIKYCMYDALDNQNKTGKKWQELFEKEVNQNKFFGFNKINHIDFVDKDTDSIGKQLIVCGKAGGKRDEHPNKLGHELWAEKLVKFIKQNELLK